MAEQEARLQQLRAQQERWMRERDSALERERVEETGWKDGDDGSGGGYYGGRFDFGPRWGHFDACLGSYNKGYVVYGRRWKERAWQRHLVVYGTPDRRR